MLQRGMQLALLSFAACAVAAGENAGVEQIEAVCHEGRTYISFRKANQSATQYQVYRLTELPSGIGSLKPLATLPAISHLHPDCQRPFVLPGGRVLTADDGLFVHTPKAREKVWFAVLPEGEKALVAGKNVTGTAIDQENSDKPGAVLQEQHTKHQQVEDHYAWWMDYEAWQADPSPGQWKDKSPEHYGSFFSITYIKGGNEGKLLPAWISMHSLGGGGNGGPFALMASKEYYRIYVSDHRKRWWDGKSAERVNAQIDYLIRCGKYKIDTARVYLEGTSMGGHGSLVHALRYPEKYAAIYAQIPKTTPKLTGQIKASVSLPPMAMYFSWKDGIEFGPQAQAPFIVGLQAAQQGCWVNWANEGHVVPKEFKPENCVPGGLFRFKRNEVFPVLTRVSADADCGQLPGGVAVTEGQINQTIDWASALHPLALPDSALVDNASELAMTFQATKPCSAHLSFRRIQAFKPVPGATLTFQNSAMSDGKVLQQGEVTVPAAGPWVLQAIQMTTAGNRIQVRLKP